MRLLSSLHGGDHEKWITVETPYGEHMTFYLQSLFRGRYHLTLLTPSCIIKVTRADARRTRVKEE